MRDTSHLHALECRLSSERMRRDSTTGSDKALRCVWVKQIEREIEHERYHLGIATASEHRQPISDMDLLSELGALP